MKFHAQRLAFFASLLGYCGLTISLGNGPMQDLPNHLARGHIMADLLFSNGSVYGSAFRFQFLFCPYLLGDIVLMTFDRFFGSMWAARIWITLAVLLIPLGALFALKSMRLPRGTVFIGAILSLYVATGWTFTMGFLNYEVSLGCALFTYGWFIRAQHSNSHGVWLCFVLTALLTYAMHLSGLVFICAVIGSECFLKGLQGALAWRRAVLLFSMPTTLLVLHFTIGRVDPGSVGFTQWPSIHEKLLDLFSPVIRFGLILDLLLFAIFLAAILTPLLTTNLVATVRRALLHWLFVGMLVGLYFTFPAVANNIAFVDVRALPYALMFAVFAGVSMGASSQTTAQAKWQLVLSCILSVTNLVYTAVVMKTEDIRIAAYRELVSTLPVGQRVLPVSTLPPIGRYRPFLHAGSYVTLQKGGLTPYLFAADINPPMAYFSYLQPRGYAPSEWWYEKITHDSVEGVMAATLQPDWSQVERQFDYLIVTLPWKPELIPSKYTLVRSNEVAALLKIPDS